MSHTCNVCGVPRRRPIEGERPSKAFKSNPRYHHDTRTWKNLKIRKAYQKHPATFEGYYFEEEY